MNSRFAADTRKLAYAQAFSRTSTSHAAVSAPAPVDSRREGTRTPLRALTTRLHRSPRAAR